MKRNKGFLLIEILITLSIFSLIIFCFSKYIINITSNNNVVFKDLYSMENEIYFIDSLVNDIFLRDVNFDILNFDILVKNNELIYSKNKEIIKYEFKDNKVLVSSKNINSKYFKRSINVLNCDNLTFKRENNILNIYLVIKNKTIHRVIKL